MIDKPVAIVSGDFCFLHVKAADFPVFALLLQNKGDCVRLFGSGNIQGSDAVASRRQVRNFEYGAVRGLPDLAENATKKFRVGHRRSSFNFQQKWRTRSGS